MCLHFFFTVVFAFFTLEAIYMYSLLSHVVYQQRHDVIHGQLLVWLGFRNLRFGLLCVFRIRWLWRRIPVGFTKLKGFFNIKTSYLYSCWLRMDSGLMIGEYVPIAFMIIIIIMLIEAAGSVDESTMSNYQVQSKPRKMFAAKPPWPSRKKFLQMQ